MTQDECDAAALTVSWLRWSQTFPSSFHRDLDQEALCHWLPSNKKGRCVLKYSIGWNKVSIYVIIRQYKLLYIIWETMAHVYRGCPRTCSLQYISSLYNLNPKMCALMVKANGWADGLSGDLGWICLGTVKCFEWSWRLGEHSIRTVLCTI